MQVFRCLKPSVGIRVRNFASPSIYAQLTMAPPDKILALTTMFKDDSSKVKVNLGAGTYRDDNNKPFVLECVKKAQKIVGEMDHEYAPIDGIPSFIKASLELVYGKSNKILTDQNMHVAAAQCISGTGGLRIIFELLNLLSVKFGRSNTIYLPSPTWPNHNGVAERAGMKVANYKYYDRARDNLDLAGLLQDLTSIPDASNVLLHVCAHNPTGLDPTPQQWEDIMRVVKSKNHVAVFDCAYQGFATGDVEKDTYPIRLFLQNNIHVILCQSYAKNFGLYGERAGCVSFTTNTQAEADILQSQLRTAIIRPMYSSPPIFGARVVDVILNTPELKGLWLKECKLMADRIHSVRTLLCDNIRALETQHAIANKRSWNHITTQVGMFCYSGLSTEQVHVLRNKYHIYCTDDGRMSMAGVNTQNVAYVAKSIFNVVYGKDV